jgi:hypothetical protein
MPSTFAFDFDFHAAFFPDSGFVSILVISSFISATVADAALASVPGIS